MHYLVVSFSHKNSDLTTREKLAFQDEVVQDAFLKEIMSHPVVNEAALLSTCNRIEIVASIKDVFVASDAMFAMLQEHSGLSLEELKGRADIYEDNGAIHHLFAVAASLDSLVVGETQIAGQLKNAFRFAYEKGYCAQKLSRAMHFAFKCAAEVRSSTDISKNPVSVASAAVAMAKEILGELGGETAVVVGAGEMSEITVKHLLNHTVNVILVNRDMDHARAIAETLQGEIDIQPFSRLKELINHHKILFTATGAPHSIITEDMVEACEFRRHWFDMAVPRDVDPLNDPQIRIYAVDDLKDVVERNIALREEQAKEAYSIVGRYVIEFFRWLQSLGVDPIVKSIREQARDSSYKELARAIDKGYLPEEHREAVEKILHGAFNTFLHAPTTKLREMAEEPMADTVVESVKLLFGIEDEVKMINKYRCEEHMDKKSDA